MRLFIAEKPSLARAVAGNFKSERRAEGYIEVDGGDVVTWCYGHLLENVSPEEYDPKYKVWRLDTLPIQVAEWRLKPCARATEQLNVIKGLLRRATVVVNAGDPDREGQLLVDEVLHFYGWKGKTERLLLNATDPGSVKKAMASIRDNKEFRPLYEAALCRSRADWLVGMNLTVAATKTFGNGKTVSVGRVQTPTLALIVKRDLEIENFKVSSFYYVTADVETDGGKLVMECNPQGADRILDQKIAKDLAEKIKGQSFPLSVERKKSRDLAPLPYMLATFQKDAETYLGVGAKQALDILQVLYEQKLTSYPRSDCEYLPGEQAGAAVGIANAILGYGALPDFNLHALLKPSPRIYDSKKVAEHHGIIPTGRLPQNNLLEPKLRKAWDLICKRFVASLLPDYEYEETRVSFSVDGRRFDCVGEVPLNAQKSWRALYPRESTPLPLKGTPATGKVTKATVKDGKTTPPKPYTEASLIADMRGIAKYVSDESLKEILKETSGIGTAATQAAIIETLKKREAIKVEKKKLVSTPFGRMVISRMPDAMTDPSVTATWEYTLGLIAKGKYNPTHFMNGIDSFIKGQLTEFSK